MLGQELYSDIIKDSKTYKKIDKMFDYIEKKNPFPFLKSFMKQHKDKYTLKDSQYLISKYPKRIPVVVDLAPGTDLPPLEKNKYLAPKDITIGQLLFIIRKQMNLNSSKAVFIYCENTVLTTSSLLSKVYHDLKYENGFLYLLVAGENTFG